MKILLSWLKEYVDWSWSEEELAYRLTMAGFEVEALERFSPGFEKVVVGKVESIGPHPNADRLTLCKVNVGSAVLSIVCGAKNIKEGDCVPVALDGAKLPGDKVLKASKIRGEYSEGMMCSGIELGFGEDRSGIWILPEGSPLGKDLAELLGMKDTALTLNVTPNRPDALSVRGIAREIASLSGTKIRSPQRKIKEVKPLISERVEIKVDHFEACPRYMARLIENVQVGPSPLWLKQALEKMGQRSVNNIVDITNWILLGLGHPLHAFDFDRIQGSQIIVRYAREGEKMTAIDGKERILNPSMLVIADAEKPLALAGVMGGKDTEVSDQTKNILLECAYFNPTLIRKTSKSLGLISESSYRFERGVDPLGLPEALDEAAALIQEIAGGQILKGAADIIEKKFLPGEVRFRPSRCRSLLGTPVQDQEIKGIFNQLGFKVYQEKTGEWNIEVPTYRPDLKGEHDLIEEVARMWGYEKIPEISPSASFSMDSQPYSKELRLRDRTRWILQGLGFSEAITYSFLSQELLKKSYQNTDTVKILNPVRTDYSDLRTSLIPHLLSVMALNENQGSLDVQIFEIGKSFFPLRKEVETLCMAVMGKADALVWKEGEKPATFFYLKGIVEELFGALGLKNVVFESSQNSAFHPGQCAQILIGKEPIGFIGEVHPDVLKNFELKQKIFLVEINFEILVRKIDFLSKFKEIPKYPSVTRDIAILVGKDVLCEDIFITLWEERSSGVLEEVKLFDIYQGTQIPEGKKSMAFSVRFRSSEGTLTVEEVDCIEQRMKTRLIERFQCQIR